MRLLKPLLLIALALAVPVVPFLVLGEPFEARVETYLRGLPPAAMAAAVVAVLAGDLVLPVPSSVVSTLAAQSLGFWMATAASWTGMMLACVVGFGLGRGLGRPIAARIAGSEGVAEADVVAGRYGPAVLVLLRGVPLLAEASVVGLGATSLGWLRFMTLAALSNLGIAATYSALGHLVRLPYAVAASIALPLGIGLAAKSFWPSAAAE